MSVFQGAPEPVAEVVVARGAAFGTGAYGCVVAVFVESGWGFEVTHCAKSAGCASAEVRGSIIGSRPL